MFPEDELENLPGIKEATQIIKNLGLQYNLVTISLGEQNTLGIVRVKDLIDLQAKGISSAPLWREELDTDIKDTGILNLSKSQVEVLENFHQWQNKLQEILDAIPSAIKRLNSF